MNQFIERYKTLSNPDLLKIIDNPGDYQPLAVEAAKEELATRHLTVEELAVANAENEAELQEKQLKTEKRNAFENRVKDIGSSFVETIHPIQQTTPSANKIITILSIILGVSFLIGFFNEFSFIKFMLTNRGSNRGFEAIFFFLLFLLTPIAAFLFWRRKKSGWILFCLYFSYSITNGVVIFFMILWHNFKYRGFNGSFHAMPPVSSIWSIIFFGGCLWLIFKNYIREIYTIDKETMIITAGSGAILTVLTVFI